MRGSGAEGMAREPGLGDVLHIEPLTVERAREVLRLAASVHRGPFEGHALIASILDRFPATDPVMLEALFVASTVNDPRRQHFPEPLDVLFMREDGRYEPYEASVHGRWTKAGHARVPWGAGNGSLSAPPATS